LQPMQTPGSILTPLLGVGGLGTIYIFSVIENLLKSII
jgi:hypothetical protein